MVAVVSVAERKRRVKGLCGQHPQSIDIFVLRGSAECPRSPESDIYLSPSVRVIRLFVCVDTFSNVLYGFIFSEMS